VLEEEKGAGTVSWLRLPRVLIDRFTSVGTVVAMLRKIVLKQI